MGLHLMHTGYDMGMRPSWSVQADQAISQVGEGIALGQGDQLGLPSPPICAPPSLSAQCPLPFKQSLPPPAGLPVLAEVGGGGSICPGGWDLLQPTSFGGSRTGLCTWPPLSPTPQGSWCPPPSLSPPPQPRDGGRLEFDIRLPQGSLSFMPTDAGLAAP